MLPVEIWEEVLSWIEDVSDICSCRTVCGVFKYMIERKVVEIKYKLEDRNLRKGTSIKFSFLTLFPNLSLLHIPLRMTNTTNITFLKSLTYITLLIKNREEILNMIPFMEDYLFSTTQEKVMKVYQGTSICWMKRHVYGKFEKYKREFDEIDGQLMDVCRCKTVISNKKSQYYFPVETFIYLCSIDQLSTFDYFPSRNLTHYIWQPVLSEDRRNINYLSLLSDTIAEITLANTKLETYHLPISTHLVPHLRTVFPNIHNYCTYDSGSISYSNNNILHLTNLPKPETFIDGYVF